MAAKHAKGRFLRAGRPADRFHPRKKRFLVVTNGEVTEPQYFRGLEGEFGNVVVEVRHFRSDPSALAETASKIKAREEASSGNADGFQKVFVVTDVDDFLPRQFRDAQKICALHSMEFVISNPCFEVWLVDHLMRCPDAFSSTKLVEQKAAELGIVYGSRNKQVNYSKIAGKSGAACLNASKHNTPGREQMRGRLDSLSFGPWTDMPDMLGCLGGGQESGLVRPATAEHGAHRRPD